MPVIADIHFGVLFIKEAIAKLGVSVRSSIRKRLACEPERRNDSVAGAKTLDHTQAED